MSALYMPLIDSARSPTGDGSARSIIKANHINPKVDLQHPSMLTQSTFDGFRITGQDAVCHSREQSEDAADLLQAQRRLLNQGRDLLSIASVRSVSLTLKLIY
jgi:hypothetical protein